MPRRNPGERLRGRELVDLLEAVEEQQAELALVVDGFAKHVGQRQQFRRLASFLLFDLVPCAVGVRVSVTIGSRSISVEVVVIVDRHANDVLILLFVVVVIVVVLVFTVTFLVFIFLLRHRAVLFVDVNVATGLAESQHFRQCVPVLAGPEFL